MTREIMIGGQLCRVPDGYLKAEAEFTKDEEAIFYALQEGPKKEEARLAVMAKRIEFNDLYLLGQVEIVQIEKPKRFNLWQKIVSYVKALLKAVFQNN